MPKLAASILTANFGNLSQDLRQAIQGGIDWIHFDVMDGHFVSNITFGSGLIACLRKQFDVFFDVHLMINQPDLYIKQFHKSGADLITVHYEACPHLHQTIKSIKDLGAKAGVALNPASPIDLLEEILPYVDLILIMTVNPGFGGQIMIQNCINKINKLKDKINKYQLPVQIEVDGGINQNNIYSVMQAGTDIFVVGSSIFNEKSTVTNIQVLKNEINKTNRNNC